LNGNAEIEPMFQIAAAQGNQGNKSNYLQSIACGNGVTNFPYLKAGPCVCFVLDFVAVFCCGITICTKWIHTVLYFSCCSFSSHASSWIQYILITL
jgi:hypothetical protein